MSLIDDPINKSESAAEKFATYVAELVNRGISNLFAEIRKTRITVTIDLGEKP